MQTKRKKRSRIRAAKDTAGHGSKKKNRGAGHRGGRGKAGTGKRGDSKLMKITKGMSRKEYLGKHGFKSMNSKKKAINLAVIQERLGQMQQEGIVSKEKDAYVIDLRKLGYDKLLSKGTVNLKLHISVDEATKNAVAKVESAGGRVVLPDENNEEIK